MPRIPQAVKEVEDLTNRFAPLEWERKDSGIPDPGTIQNKKASGWEVMVARELDRRRLSYEFQVSIMGGRSQAGGKILDFLVYTTPLVIIRVQGTYWHRGAINTAKDAEERFALYLRYPGCVIVDVSQEEVMNIDLLRALLEVCGYG